MASKITIWIVEMTNSFLQCTIFVLHCKISKAHSVTHCMVNGSMTPVCLSLLASALTPLYIRDSLSSIFFPFYCPCCYFSLASSPIQPVLHGEDIRNNVLIEENTCFPRFLQNIHVVVHKLVDYRHANSKRGRNLRGTVLPLCMQTTNKE